MVVRGQKEIELPGYLAITKEQFAVNEINRIQNAEGVVYAILSYEPAKNYLLMKWIGFCTDEELIQATLIMQEWQQKTGTKLACRFHVHDTKEFGVAWVGAVDWIVHEYFPPLYEAGVRYNISIVSPDLFSKLSSEALFEKSNPVIPTRLCETLSEAERFIAEQNQIEGFVGG